LFYLCRFHRDMATCRPTLFLLTVKKILLVHFVITNFRVAHKMLCTPWLRNPLTTSRLSCLGRKATLTTIFLSVRQSRISQPCYTNNYCLKTAQKGQITKNCIKNSFHKTMKHSFFKITRVYATRFLILNSCFKTGLMKLVF
jgi:hypothetical protein